MKNRFTTHYLAIDHLQFMKQLRHLATNSHLCGSSIQLCWCNLYLTSSKFAETSCARDFWASKLVEMS